MADSVLVAVTSGLASAAIAGTLTYVTTISKIRQDLAAQYDADLRRARIEVYKQLWRGLQPLATYAAERALTCNDACALASTLRCWYFEVGGLFLSLPAREAYFDLQDGLMSVQERSDHPVPDAKREELIKLGSTLRSQLARDVGTRAQPILGDRLER